MLRQPAFALGLLTGILAGCTRGEVEADTAWTPRERALLLGMALPETPPLSPGNAVADSPAMLGKTLTKVLKGA